MSGLPPTGPPIAVGSSGDNNGARSSPEQPSFEPKIDAPKFDGTAATDAGSILVMLTLLNNYFDYLVRKGMPAARAIEHIASQCMTGSALTWSMTTSFDGTWADFKAKFCSRFLPENRAEKAGFTLLYGTHQNDSSIHDYNTAFRSAISMCDLVMFAYTPQVLLVAYRRGLNAACKSVLSLCPLPLQTFQACADYLVQADAKLQVGGILGSQPRPSKYGSGSRNDKKPYQQHNSSNQYNSNSNYQSDRWHGMNAGNSDRNGPVRDHNAGRGHPGPSSSSSSSGRRWTRDASHLDCNRCGVRGHVAMDCRADLEKVDEFRRRQKK